MAPAIYPKNRPVKALRPPQSPQKRGAGTPPGGAAHFCGGALQFYGFSGIIQRDGPAGLGGIAEEKGEAPNYGGSKKDGGGHHLHG